jgi:hypothetical protein
MLMMTETIDNMMWFTELRKEHASYLRIKDASQHDNYDGASLDLIVHRLRAVWYLHARRYFFMFRRGSESHKLFQSLDP